MNNIKIFLMIILQWTLSFFLMESYASNPLEEDYICNVLNSIRYGDTPIEVLKEAEKRVSDSDIPEGVYPRIMPELTKLRNQLKTTNK